MLTGEPLYLDLLLGVAVPAAVGLPLAKWIGPELRRHGTTPLGVRVARVVVTIVWVSIATTGLEIGFGPFSFLSTLTISAIGGIAATLALQTTLQNMVAGYILLRRGFLHVGDAVSVSGIKGTVAGLGLVTVVLRTEDGTLAFVSNSNLLSGPFLNYSATKRLGSEY